MGRGERGAWFFFPYHPSLPGLTPPPPPPPPMALACVCHFSAARVFLSSGRGGVFKLDWALVEVQAAQSLVFFPSACKTPVLVCLVASPKQTREAQADSHHTALSRIFYIYFIFYPFPFFLSFFFCHWFLFLIEWRVAKHRAKCRILFFPVKKQCVYKVYMSCKMRPLILTCCIKVIWLIFLILPSLLIFQPIPRAPASAPCSSPSCPSSSSSSPCPSPYASRSRRVPTNVPHSVWNKNKNILFSKTCGNEWEAGMANLCQKKILIKTENMDPTQNKTTSGKNSNLAWALWQTSPPHSNKHPNSNLYSCRTWLTVSPQVKKVVLLLIQICRWSRSTRGRWCSGSVGCAPGAPRGQVTHTHNDLLNWIFFWQFFYFFLQVCSSSCPALTLTRRSTWGRSHSTSRRRR